jgi:protein-tyrosine phosphatase
MGRLGVRRPSDSFNGHRELGPYCEEVAHWLIQCGAVHILATDSHDLRNRPPNLSDASDIVARKYGPEVAKANPRAVVEDQPLPYFPRT